MGVAEASLDALGDVRGLILGGRGDLKSKLLAEFPPALRQATVRVVDLACHAGMDGLQKVATHIGEVAEEGAAQVVESLAARFFDLVSQTSTGSATVVCYGEEETLVALKMGVVDRLLVANTHIGRLCGRAELAQLAADSGTAFVDVKARTETTCRFCDSFRIAALLRHQVDPLLLEPEAEEVAAGDESDVCCCDSLAEAEIDSISTAASSPDNPVTRWLQGALATTMKDPIIAESLAICADLVLSDVTTDADERMENVVGMLRAEGVPEDVLLELACHIADQVSLHS